ncbi:hypothetical protein EDC04DRAFT_2604235 [Pisolithus marmoratus]|nr:hypothetical protein EDC04DRAFT_2604235 [Pisolithus marmoratus]
MSANDYQQQISKSGRGEEEQLKRATYVCQRLSASVWDKLLVENGRHTSANDYEQAYEINYLLKMGDIRPPTNINKGEETAETGDKRLPTAISKGNMARTSMNAKKATSGAAPRIKLGLKPTRAIAARTPRANSSRATRGTSRRTTRRASVESISSLSSLTTAPPSPVHDGVLLPQQMVQWPTNRYCYLCHDGSKVLFCCDFCPRVVCQRCLGLAEVNPDLLAADVTFKCPGCHELGERDAQCKLSPYHAFMRNVDGRSTRVLEGPIIIRGVCERVSKTQVCAESTLILHLVCVGMDHSGSLPKLLHTSLEDYHTEDSLVYEEVFFDFGTDKKLRQWNRQASVLGARLAARNFGRKIIFITVHSEINRGDLFAGKDKAGGDVAMEVEDFMKCIFTPPLDKVVYASTLFMLTCGHLVAFDESYTTMKQAIIRLRPEYTIMFTAPDFISAVAKMFVVTYSIQVLIQGHDLFAVFQDLLNVSTDLRMHTDVLIFYIRVGTDIRGTTVIGAHGARLCLWDAQRAAPFVRGPDRNVQKVRVRSPKRPRRRLGFSARRKTEKISSIIDIRLLSTNRIAEKLGAKVLSAASVFREIEMFHPIEPSTIPRNMLVSLAFCESDNYAKRAAILRWTAAFECSPYCKLDMYRTIHALHACSPPSGPHRLLSSMFQVHPTVDVSLGILMVSARAGMDALHGICSCDNAADDSRGTTVDSLSMEARRGPRIYEPQGFSGVGSSWGGVEDDRGGTATFECSRTDPYPDAEKVIVHLFERISRSLDLGTESDCISASWALRSWSRKSPPSRWNAVTGNNMSTLLGARIRPRDPTDTPLKQLVCAGHVSPVRITRGLENFPFVLLGACDCVERDTEACRKFIDPTVNDALESPLAPQQMDAPKHGCEESLSVAGSARRPTVLNYLRRSLADKREGHVPRRDSNAEPVYSSIEPQVLENGTTKTEAECLCYR